MVSAVNLLFAGAAVMVLFAQEKLRVDPVGFGLLFSGSAVGGVLGSLVAARMTRVVGTARVTVWTLVASDQLLGRVPGPATSVRGRRPRSGPGCWPAPVRWR
jgi:hypothetical protein